MHLTYRRQYQPAQYEAEEITLATTVLVEDGEDPFEVVHVAAVAARDTAHLVLGIPLVRPSKPFEPGEVVVKQPVATDQDLDTYAPAPIAGLDSLHGENIEILADGQKTVVTEAPKTPTRFTKAAAKREIAAMVEAGELDEGRLSLIVQKWDDMAEEAADARARVTGTAVTQEVESGVAAEIVSPQALMTKVADISNRLGDGGAAAVRALFPKFSDPDGRQATRLGEIPESRRAAFIAAAEALLGG